jgi:hypothetical protein
MPRSPRLYSEKSVYEIVPRARENLPMPPTQTSNEIRLGILGRTQRDNKVELCHFVEMNNHSHSMAVSITAVNLNKFHMELKKKTTDAVKALLGLSSLYLWEKRTGVFKIATLEDAIERVVYIYCNPSNAALCDTIDEYPGLSSWVAFKECAPSCDAEVEIDAQWYPVSELPQIPLERRLTPQQDANLYCELKGSEKAVKHPIVLKPFKWLETYGVTDPKDIEKIRQKIITRVQDQERENAIARAQSNRTSVPRATLQSEPYMKPYTPKKKERKIFLICGDKELRLALLETFRLIKSRCKECYEKAKAGIRVEWPPGTFIPWFPPGFVFPLPAAV